MFGTLVPSRVALTSRVLQEGKVGSEIMFKHLFVCGALRRTPQGISQLLLATLGQ